MTKRSRGGPVVAAGALVWRERKGQLEVLLIHRPRYDDWSWPKGKLDPDEPTAVAAVREVAEETGLHVALGVPLPMLSYSNGNGRRKEVHYWAATALPADSPAVVARGKVDQSVDEVDDMRWLPPTKATKMLTRSSDRKPLKALVKLHEAGQLATRAVVVVRHASAVSRPAWDGREADRPLTPAGVAQAEALVPVLAAFGVESIVTSPWDRCTATVAPYEAATGIEAEEVDLLTEDSHRDTPTRVETLAGTLYAAVGAAARTAVTGFASLSGGVAVCTHRPVLPSILGPIDAMAPGWVRRARPRKDPYLRPASVAVIHAGHDDAGPRVVSFEAHALHGAQPVEPLGAPATQKKMLRSQ